MPLMPFGDHTPQVLAGSFVAPTATLIGQVHIGENVSIMFGAVIRADREAITVGDGSNLQDTAVLHGDPGFPTHIGAGVSVGHGAIVHGAHIGDHCLIGMGATVLNGAQIGEGCLIAAGTVILEGTVIPPRSLVAGVPGKIRRAITDEEFHAILVNAATYRELGAHYRGNS
jgi:carbonic anhydrase/acetyltransferase-like protein (isoleucine patch superfamily)